MNAMEMRFPRHAYGLLLKHNEHRNYSQLLPDWLRKRALSEDAWAAEGQKEAVLATGECWHLLWYPDTPFGFMELYAADLEVLLAAAVELQRVEDEGRRVA